MEATAATDLKNGSEINTVYLVLSVSFSFSFSDFCYFLFLRLSPFQYTELNLWIFGAYRV